MMTLAKSKRLLKIIAFFFIFVIFALFYLYSLQEESPTSKVKSSENSFVLTKTLKALISDNYPNNQYIFLNLWASWCEPCLAEMPDLLSISEKNSDKNIKVILLNLDTEINDIKKAESVAQQYKKLSFSFLDLEKVERIKQELNITGLPMSLLIKGDQIIATITGSVKVQRASIESMLKDYL